MNFTYTKNSLMAVLSLGVLCQVSLAADSNPLGDEARKFDRGQNAIFQSVDFSMKEDNADNDQGHASHILKDLATAYELWIHDPSRRNLDYETKLLGRTLNALELLRPNGQDNELKARVLIGFGNVVYKGRDSRSFYNEAVALSRVVTINNTNNNR